MKKKNHSEIIESLYELSYFYYRNNQRKLKIYRFTSDMRHDMSSSQRKLRFERLYLWL